MVDLVFRINLPVFWHPNKRVWGFGYWCDGPESLSNDGLLCYHNLRGISEEIREKDLAKLWGNPLSAFLDWIKHTRKMDG